MEIWKDIPNYKGLYQVSSLGNIKSVKRKVKHFRGGFSVLKEKLLKVYLNKSGYCYVTLTKNCVQKNFATHQLVAMAFLNHNPCGHKLVVDHINTIKNDNRLENLQVITHRKNISKDKIGGSSKYVGVTFSKITNLWISNISIKGKVKYLGSFKDEYQAHLAYQSKLKEIQYQ